MSFPGRAVQRTWHLVDATSQTVGRLATTIAPILRGKHKPTFRPNGDCGDYVVVINADKVRSLFSSISFYSLCYNVLVITRQLSISHTFSYSLRYFQVHLSGKKWNDKIYRWHTGYPGGLKERPAKDMLDRKPEFILKKAILGMLYRNNLRQSYMEPRLKIYAGSDHPHKAQLPDGVQTLPVHPRKRTGNFHFGMGKKYSATPYQVRLGESNL